MYRVRFEKEGTRDQYESSLRLCNKPISDAKIGVAVTREPAIPTVGGRTELHGRRRAGTIFEDERF